jgi:hypothetical protein
LTESWGRSDLPQNEEVKMNKYYKYKDAEAYVLYEEIHDGMILTEFNPETGISIANSHLKFYVPHEEFERDYTKFTFMLSSNENEKKVIKRTLDNIIFQLENHGIEEDNCKQLQSLHIPHILSENPEFDLESSMEHDEWFENQDCENLFYFIKSLVPILKQSFALIKNLEKEF